MRCVCSSFSSQPLPRSQKRFLTKSLPVRGRLQKSGDWHCQVATFTGVTLTSFTPYSLQGANVVCVFTFAKHQTIVRLGLEHFVLSKLLIYQLLPLLEELKLQIFMSIQLGCMLKLCDSHQSDGLIVLAPPIFFLWLIVSAPPVFSIRVARSSSTTFLQQQRQRLYCW